MLIPFWDASCTSLLVDIKEAISMHLWLIQWLVVVDGQVADHRDVGSLVGLDENLNQEARLECTRKPVPRSTALPRAHERSQRIKR